MDILNYPDEEYKSLVRRILFDGEHRSDRTGTGTFSLFGEKLTYPATTECFPLLTSKRIYTKAAFGEMLWFLSGSTNNNDLLKDNITIWNEWANEDGALGPVYGHQWRNFNSQNVDQIENLIEGIKSDPYSRRHIVSAWNPAQLPDMALPPCHMMFQLYCHASGQIDMQMYQRSADVFLGLPFNMAGYGLLLNIIAQQTGRYAGVIHHVIGDAHIYKNHRIQMLEQIERPFRTPPTFRLDKAEHFTEYTLDNIHIDGYNPHPAIKGDVAV